MYEVFIAFPSVENWREKKENHTAQSKHGFKDLGRKSNERCVQRHK